MNKIGIATVYTGYNYGSALQAYATKNILRDMGYEADILKIKGSVVAGRDIRIGKLITILFRSLVHRKMNNLKNYKTSVSKQFPQETFRLFDSFIQNEISPTLISYKKLKRLAKTDEYKAFICGSDQVWNAAVLYVDPFYYLRFAPADKRIAFAPSFGRDFVPDYNKKKIGAFISGIRYKSVRESSGTKVIRDLTGTEATVLVDPTLSLSSHEWTNLLQLKEREGKPYLLAYFLDEPTESAKNTVSDISHKHNLEVIWLPYMEEAAGPVEFVSRIKNASFVCTDSFHGTAFSLNFNVPFYTFERDYGDADKQSARIKSILELTHMQDRYEPANLEDCMDLSFDSCNKILDTEREKARKFLEKALQEME